MLKKKAQQKLFPSLWLWRQGALGTVLCEWVPSYCSLDLVKMASHIVLKNGRNCQKFCFPLADCWKSEFWKVLSVSKISPEPLRSHQMFSICMFSLSLFWPCQCRRASKNHNTQNMGFFWLIFNYLALRAKITVFPETPHKCQVLKREYVVNIWGWCRVFRMLNNRIKHNAA